MHGTTTSGRYFLLTCRLARWWAAPGNAWLFRATQRSLVAVLLLLAGWIATISLVGVAKPSTDHLLDSWWAAVASSVAIGFIVILLTGVCIALFIARLMIRVVTDARDASVGDVISSAARLLEAHGFELVERGDASLRATRNEQHFIDIVELEWRSVPIDVTLNVAKVGNGSVLRATCFPEFPGQSFCTRTAQAVVDLNDDALSLLDQEVVKALPGATTGRIARNIRDLVFTTALLVGIGLGGMGLWIIGNMVAKESEDFMLARSNEAIDSITRSLEGQLRTQIALAESLTSLDGRQGIAAVEALAANLKSPSSLGIPVIAVSVERQWRVLLPSHPNAISPDGMDDLMAALKAGSLGKLRKVGDMTAYFLAYQETSLIKERLGIKDAALTIGVLVTPNQLAALAVDRFYIRQLKLYQQGRAYARIHFSPAQDPAAEGEKAIPPDQRPIPPAVDIAFRTQDVSHRVQGQRKPSDLDEATELLEKFVALFFPKVRPEFLWHENGGVEVYRVELEPRSGQLNGYSASFDNRYGGLFRHEEVIWMMAAAVWWLLLIFPAWWGGRIARRIANPIIGIRDAMRIIAKGDYSVRIAQEGNDEIGQLQKHLNNMAEELQKREAIKELMGKYLSKQVADRILESGSEGALAETRREVTVLFADVRGFTSFAEKHEPEQVTKSLNEYFEAMVEVIAEHDGVLDKYIGDGLMVVFGSPVIQPDHAHRGVLTALAMQAALQSLNLKRQRRGDEPINIGIGVNTGLAISGNLGSIQRMEFTVIGDTVNTAARLESKAERGQILIGKKTYELVKERVVAESLGLISVKGKAEQIEVWAVKGLASGKP